MLKAPFPYFGGKSRIAPVIWQHFGIVANYVEPFCGSGAVLLDRPQPAGVETVNDADGLLCNFWRALRADPEAVAKWADWPVVENDLHARHMWLVQRKDSMQARLEGDPDWYDPQAAGWWVWSICIWIAGQFCSGRGPWKLDDGKLIHNPGSDAPGITRCKPAISNGGRGIHRKVRPGQTITEYLRSLSDRLRHVRVCCGDWSRVCTPSVTHSHGLTAIFLDPPYADTAKRDPKIYRIDSEQVAHAVRAWAIQEGSNPLMRIALCGYEGEHQMPGNWRCVSWNAGGGYGNQRKSGKNLNHRKERVWFSPHCLVPV